MIHSLQYPIQWIRKVVLQEELNNLLQTLVFQTESYVTVRGKNRETEGVHCHCEEAWH